jgi:hypothetical protein
MDAAHMAKDTDLDPLREREDFKKPMGDLQAASKTRMRGRLPQPAVAARPVLPRRASTYRREGIREQEEVLPEKTWELDLPPTAS